MTMIEVACQLWDHAQVLVGSQKTEPGLGWPHAAIPSVQTARMAMTPAELGVPIKIASIRTGTVKRSRSPAHLTLGEHTMARKGPFGLWMRMTLSDLDTNLSEIALGKYKADSVPTPHSAFERYVLQITPKCGLSWIKAIGHAIQTSVYGLELRNSFDSMEAKLTATYGKSQRTDLLMQDSIWNEPRDWIQSLLNKERFLMTVWSPDHGSSLGDSLSSVALLAGALDTSSGYIAIEYSFENSSEADAELSALEDRAL